MEEIICKKCGTHAAAGESFCGGCGAFLEWEGERVVVPTAVPAEAPAAGAAGPGGHTVSSVEPAPPPAKADGPGAVQPAVPRDRPRPPPPKLAQGRRAEPGDIICGQCGQPNVPSRRFCRRCGSFLPDQDRVAVRLPWWRRLFGGKRGHQGPGPSGSAPSAGVGPNGPTPGATASGGPPAAATAGPARHGAPALPAAARSSHPPARPPTMPGAHSSGYRAPTSMPRQPRRAGKAVLGLVVLAAIVVSVDPTLRNKAVSAAHRVRYDLFPAYPKVPLQAAVASGSGACGPAQLLHNDTVYWYTRSLSDSPQALSITVAPTFTGTVDRLAFTPLVPTNQAAPSGQASPNPQEVILTAQPPGTPRTPITLDNPPKFQQATVKVKRATEVRLRLVSTDPGAAPTTCAETAVVLYERKG